MRVNLGKQEQFHTFKVGLNTDVLYRRVVFSISSLSRSVSDESIFAVIDVPATAGPSHRNFELY